MRAAVLFPLFFFPIVFGRCTFSGHGKRLICRGIMGAGRFDRILVEKSKNIEILELINIESPGICGIRKKPLTEYFPKLKKIRVSPKRLCRCVGKKFKIKFVLVNFPL
jgi:hypothetical protein